jgi:hypothetical protein
MPVFVIEKRLLPATVERVSLENNLREIFGKEFSSLEMDWEKVCVQVNPSMRSVSSAVLRALEMDLCTQGVVMAVSARVKQQAMNDAAVASVVAARGLGDPSKAYGPLLPAAAKPAPSPSVSLALVPPRQDAPWLPMSADPLTLDYLPLTVPKKKRERLEAEHALAMSSAQVTSLESVIASQQSQMQYLQEEVIRQHAEIQRHKAAAAAAVAAAALTASAAANPPQPSASSQGGAHPPPGLQSQAQRAATSWAAIAKTDTSAATNASSATSTSSASSAQPAAAPPSSSAAAVAATTSNSSSSSGSATTPQKPRPKPDHPKDGSCGPCKFFLMNKHCSYGQSCRYCHDPLHLEDGTLEAMKSGKWQKPSWDNGPASGGGGGTVLVKDELGFIHRVKESTLLANKDKDKEEEPQRLTCSICLENRISVCLQPCGHATFCWQCISHWQDKSDKDKISCPICRKTVDSIFEIKL